MMTKIYDLAYEIDGDTINLEQDGGCGEVDRIALHPIHLRLLLEETGLLAPSSNIEADRTIARLCRQMRILLDRINTLDDWLNEAAARGHEDLEAETTYSFATWELASEFVYDLPAMGAGRERQLANGPENACVSTARDPKNGAASDGKNPNNVAIAPQGQAALGLEGPL